MNFNFSKLSQRIQMAKWMLLGYESDRGRASIKVSFSQNGEDLILWQIFSSLGIQQPFYIDIGAHDPKFLSNTMLFYFTGSSGINIEPDPELCSKFLSARPRDTNMNIGIGNQEGSFEFYRMSPRYISTFNKAEATRLVEEENFKLEEVLTIPVKRINQIFQQAQQPVDLLSIDTEGNDLAILKDLDFKKNRPKVICAETLQYSSQHGNQQVTEIGKFLMEVGYQEYANTQINTIFVEQSLKLS